MKKLKNTKMNGGESTMPQDKIDTLILKLNGGNRVWLKNNWVNSVFLTKYCNKLEISATITPLSDSDFIEKQRLELHNALDNLIDDMFRAAVNHEVFQK